MKKGEFITAVLFIIIALVVLGDALRLGRGWTPDGPQAGFVPFYMGLLMLGCSIALLVRSIKFMTGEEGFFVSPAGRWEAVRIFFTATLLTISIVYMGVYISTFAYCILFSKWLGKHRWPAVIAFSVIMVLAIFYGMEKGLKIPLPKSPLYHKGMFIF